MCYPVNVNQEHSINHALFSGWGGVQLSNSDNITEHGAYEKFCNRKKFLHLQGWKINSDYVTKMKCF